MGVKRSHPGALRDIIALNVRRIRTEKGLTQDALADLCELDRTYVGSIERPRTCRLPTRGCALSRRPPPGPAPRTARPRC
ncbi:helix-turn-helix transcriptional regulator, partial [Kitasatospora sp. NPDC097691]|uniref:helix-turn-helix transcriptional regulator n=1 Tax=Kitasatospora sp. NPDC097691 TaxID=3157231 RepID=UPI003316B72F